MTESDILSILREFLWGATLMALPLLSAALIVGLVVGLFQALTSIQEMTLTFVPKLGAMLLVYFLSAGFMVRVLIDLFDSQVIPMISG